jgi:hypothetical protein
MTRPITAILDRSTVEMLSQVRRCFDGRDNLPGMGCSVAVMLTLSR